MSEISKIDKLKEYAADLLPIDAIAILLEIDELLLRELISDHTSEASKAYYFGQAETIAAIHKQEVELAKAGSPLAVENVADYIIEQKTSENG